MEEVDAVDAVGLGLGAVVEEVDGDVAAAGFCWLLFWRNGLEVAIVRLDRGSLAVCVYPSDLRAGADRTERTNWGTAIVLCFAGAVCCSLLESCGNLD